MALKFEEAGDIKEKIVELVSNLNLKHIDISSITCFRSKGSKTRAYARIWEFPRIWQLALNNPPHYIIELISHKFDRLSAEEQEKILIHELMHIPRNFSGSLRPHGKKVSKYLDDKIHEMHNNFRRQ
jgi:predicted metallopeptidase